MNSRIKDLLSNTLLFTIANLGSKIMVFLMVPLYTAVLTTEEYGIADIIQTTSGMLLPILTAKIADAVLRFCYLKQYSTNDVYSVGIRFSFFGAIICLFLSIILSFIPLFNNLGYNILFIPLIFLFDSLSDLFHKYCRGIDKVNISATAGLLTTATMIISNLVFLLVLKIGIVGYLLSFVIGNSVAVAYMYLRVNARNAYTKQKQPSLRKEMLNYSIPLVPNSLSWWALSYVNRFFMLSWLGVSAVGIYSATLRIPSILTVLCDIFAQAWLLTALKDYGSDESKRFIRSMHNKYFSVSIILCASIILLSHPLSKLLLSGDFCEYWWLTPFLFIAVFWGAMINFLGSIFSSERKNTMQFVSTMVGAFVSVLVTFVFLKQYGVIIVAISSLVGYFTIWIIRRLSVNKFLNIGYSTIYSVIQGSILVLEAVFVVRGKYLWAVLCFLVLLILNHKELLIVLRFGISSVIDVIQKKLK